MYYVATMCHEQVFAGTSMVVNKILTVQMLHNSAAGKDFIYRFSVHI